MKNLDKVTASIEAELDEKDQVREIALKSSRAVARLSGKVLSKMHRGADIGTDIEELRDEVSRMRSLLRDHHELEAAGYVEAALQEYAEACILMSLLRTGDVPLLEDIEVGNVSYLLGLGDTVGELRRFCLDTLKRGDVAKANQFLEWMEDIYSALMRFDYPDAIVAVRRKQDIARSLLEKTRGEVAVSASSKSLQDKIEQVLKRA